MTELTKSLPQDPDVIAPDGLEVRELASGEKGSMAHFHLPAGKTGKAVQHRTVEEIWYFVMGDGEMWRSGVGVVAVRPGVSVRIPVGTQFQVKAGDKGVSAVAITMPPWPGENEAFVVEGHWNTDL